MLVDRLTDEREAAIMDTGPPVSHAGLTAGVVPLDDSGLAVMPNVTGLLDRFRQAGNIGATPLVTTDSESKTEPEFSSGNRRRGSRAGWPTGFLPT